MAAQAKYRTDKEKPRPILWAGFEVWCTRASAAGEEILNLRGIGNCFTEIVGKLEEVI